MARLDCAIQLRVEKLQVATIALWCSENGAHEALRSASALARWAVEQVYNSLVQDGARPIRFSDEADKLLGDLGVFPRTIVSGYMNNLREESGFEVKLPAQKVRVAPGRAAQYERRRNPYDEETFNAALERMYEDHPELRPQVQPKIEEVEDEPDGTFDPQALRKEKLSREDE